MARPSWISRLFAAPKPPGPPIIAVDMIQQRRAFFDWSELNQNLPPMKEFHEHVMLGELSGRQLAAEVYVPKSTKPLGVLLYIHGGAFCTLSPAHVRKFGMRLAADNYVVINLDYSLAPERPFPRGVEDTIYAARWITRNAKKYGWDGKSVVIGGDSAGANLAAAAAAFLTGSATAPIVEGDLSGVDVNLGGLLLLYGVYDFAARMIEPSTTPGTTEIMSNLAYLGTHFLAQHRNPLVSPIRATTLAKFPPSYLSCGSWDATLNQSLAMTRAMADLDVDVTLSIMPKFDHEFLLIADKDPVAEQEFQRILTWLARQQQ